MNITYDINKQFGKRFTDFRTEEFVTIQNIIRSIAKKFSTMNSSCDVINKNPKKENVYIASFVADNNSKQEIISYFLSELEDNCFSESNSLRPALNSSQEFLNSIENEDMVEYTAKVLCLPYIINPVSKEKIDADEFYINIRVVFLKDSKTLTAFLTELKKYYSNL